MISYQLFGAMCVECAENIAQGERVLLELIALQEHASTPFFIHTRCAVTRELQAACSHLRDGRFKDGHIICGDCDKDLGPIVGDNTC